MAKEYKSVMLSTYLSIAFAIENTINSAVQDGWELESMQPLYRGGGAEIFREVLLLFSRDRKEQA